MRVHLLQIDGSVPNIALMRLATHHKALGDEVIRRSGNCLFSVQPGRFEPNDRIYASTIFLRSRPIVAELLRNRPDAIVGGTGWDFSTTLEGIGVDTAVQDYSIYPRYRQSIGFTQRGCRLNCSFCVVPKKEGKVKATATIADIWRGDPWPREIILLDNDFFGQPQWQERIAELREGNFKVSFNQGINARCLTDAAAEAIAAVNYRDDQMKDKRIYTAWDSRSDEEKLFAGLNRLVKYGVKPDHIMVYMLIGFWPNETAADREYRRARLRDFGCRPFPMAYITDTTPPELARELRGFQRWVIRRCDLMCSWEAFKRSGYDSRNMGGPSPYEALNFAVSGVQ